MNLELKLWGWCYSCSRWVNPSILKCRVCERDAKYCYVAEHDYKPVLHEIVYS